MGSRYNSNSHNEDYLKNLRDQYISQLTQLKPIFQDWQEQDLLMTLEDVGGDLELAINRITEGYFYFYLKYKSFTYYNFIKK